MTRGLGPSNDTPKAVQTEMLAAAIAIGQVEPVLSGSIWLGLQAAECGGELISFLCSDIDPIWAGWLAFQIVNHDEINR